MAKHATRQGKVAIETGTKRATHWPKTVQEIVDVLSALFAQRGYSQAEAEAEAAAAELARYFGGRQFYIPFNLKAKLAARNAEICRDFSPGKVPELAARYGLSEITIYKIVQKEDEHRRAARRRKEAGL